MNFQEEINIINNNPNDYKIYLKSFKRNIKVALKFVKIIKQKNPSINYCDFHNIYENEISQIMLNCSNPSKSDFCLYDTLEKIINNPNLILDTLKKMDRSTLFSNDISSKYDFDEKTNIEKIIKSLFTGNSQLFDTEIRVKIVKMDLNDSLKKILLDALLSQTQELYNYVENSVIRDGLINRISRITNFLDTYGFLEIYNRKNNNNLALKNLDILMFEYDNPKSKHSTIKDLTKPDFLKNLPLTELMAINAFLSNRFEKELNNLENSLYILDKLDILEKLIENTDYKFSIDDNTLQVLFSQIEYIETFIFNRNKQDFFEKIISTGTLIGSSTYTKEISSSIFDEFAKDKSEEYSSHYNKLLPNVKHNLTEDSLSLSSKFLNKRNLYLYKNFSFISLINYLTNHPEINWGYIFEYDEEGKNTIETNSQNIGIGIDIEGLNYPLRLHAKKSDILKIFNSKKIKPVIPIYEGYSDMIVDGKYLSTQILMPIEKYQKKVIKKLSQTIPISDPRYNFITHMNWICDKSNIPDSIKKHNVSINYHRTINLLNGDVELKPRFPSTTNRNVCR